MLLSLHRLCNKHINYLHTRLCICPKYFRDNCGIFINLKDIFFGPSWPLLSCLFLLLVTAVCKPEYGTVLFLQSVLCFSYFFSTLSMQQLHIDKLDKEIQVLNNILIKQFVVKEWKFYFTAYTYIKPLPVSCFFLCLRRKGTAAVVYVYTLPIYQIRPLQMLI